MVEHVAPAELLEELHEACDRQAHDGEEVTLDALDERRAVPLDAVGAGLVERLARGDVLLGGRPVEGAEADAREAVEKARANVTKNDAARRQLAEMMSAAVKQLAKVD